MDREDRVHIYLCSGTCGLNLLLNPYHQLDSKLGLSLAQKEVQKALHNLKQFLGSKLPRPRLISDSKTALCLTTKPAVTLVLGTGLLAAQVQDPFGGGGPGSGLDHAPGSTFNESIDLLTRYDPLLADKIGPEFYSPSFLKHRAEDRITVPVADVTSVANLPKMSPAVLKYAMIPGTGNANVFTAQKLNPT